MTAALLRCAVLGYLSLLIEHVRCEPLFYNYPQPGYPLTKFATPQEPCNAWRDVVQAAEDSVNPGGVATVKAYPDPVVLAYPSEKNAAECVVNWTRTVNGQTSSFDYGIAVLSGGCLVGRRPKPNAPYFFAEPDDCVPYRDRRHDKPPTCTGPAYGNPIYPLTGSKGLTESLGGSVVGGQRVIAVYDTRRKVPASDATPIFGAVPAASFGELWSSSLHKNLFFQVDTPSSSAIQASRGSGAWVSFANTGAGYVPDADVADRLVQISGGWRYYDTAAQSQENYDSAGKLLNASYASGATLTYTYSDGSTPLAVAPVAGLLITVQDQLGRSVRFQYEQPSASVTPRIKQIIDPQGNVAGVLYDANNNLTQFNWPDGKTRQYLYERSDLPWAVTGIVDENASRLATYGYDAQGRANDTQWAGGADHYTASYTSAPSWNIVETYDSTAQVVWRDHYWTLAQGTVVTRALAGPVAVG